MGQVDHSVGVAPLVVVPGDDLDEAVVESDAGVGVEDGGAGIGGEVLGDDLVLSVSEETLELALRGSLDALLDLFVGGVGAELDGEVDDGDVSGGDTEGHAGELSVEFRDDLTDSLGGTGGGRDDVAAGGAASTPVLASLGRSVDGELVHGDGVDGGHETLLDAPVVVEDLGDGSEAVGGARGVGDNLHGGVVLLMVDAHHEDGGVILGRSRDDSLLGATLDVGADGVLVHEDTSALGDVVGADLTPRDLAGIGLLEDVDLGSVDFDATVGLLDSAVEASYLQYDIINKNFKERAFHLP